MCVSCWMDGRDGDVWKCCWMAGSWIEGLQSLPLLRLTPSSPPTYCAAGNISERYSRFLERALTACYLLYMNGFDGTRE